MAMTAEGLRQPLIFTVDIKNGLIQQPIRPQLMKGDKRANTIVVRMMDGSQKADMTGTTVTGSFISPVGGAEIPLTGSVRGNEVSVTLVDECYAEDGYFEANVKLTLGTTARTILSITGHVLSKGSGAMIDVGNVIPNIDDLIAQYQTMKDVTESTRYAGTSATTAAQNANKEATRANEAAAYANDAAEGASGWANATMTATALPAGSAPTATVTTASDGHKIISVGIPKGDTGVTPKITVEVSTGAAGSEAEVGVSGTAENPIIHLTIPRGDTGAIESLTINGKPVESGTITLKAEDIGALSADGTAADSAKLGGKAPSGYTPKKNLLDNSDFSDLVAQARLLGKHGTTTYLADRWMVSSGTITAVQNREFCRLTYTGSIGTIQQNMPGNLAGRTLTFAIRCRCADTIYLEFCDHSGTRISNKGFNNVDGIVCYSITVPSDISNVGVKLYVSYYDGTIPTDVYWAAVYDGEFTADSLPPYVPKGYDAELAECMRYLMPLGKGESENSVQWFPAQFVSTGYCMSAVSTGIYPARSSYSLTDVTWGMYINGKWYEVDPPTQIRIRDAFVILQWSTFSEDKWPGTEERRNVNCFWRTSGPAFISFDL